METSSKTPPKAARELTVEEFVEHTLLSHKDDLEIFARQLIKDNLLTARSLKKIGEEYATFRNEMVAVSRVGNGPSVAAIRRAVAQSDSRLAKFFGVEDPATIKPTQAEASS